MILSMIVAMDKNCLIGAKGKMPWHLPQELKYFKRTTLGKPVIMGRKTFDSIGKPLPGRTNIVITTQQGLQIDGVTVTHNFVDALKEAKDNLDESNEVMVMGGANIYAQTMSDINKLYLTIIDHEFKGDTWLDGYDPDHWMQIGCESVAVSDGNPYAYAKKTLIRKSVETN